MRSSRSQDAVSPVVGVMLMLSVTVMIAAIVSTYAGGFSDTSEKVPQTSFRVRANLLENRTYFDHTGGDPLSLNTIQVVFIRGEQKTTLSRGDTGNNCINFTQVGTRETTVRAGDTFYLEGETPDNHLEKESHTGIRFGKMILMKNSEIIWMVIDTQSSKTVAMGSLYL